MYHIPLDMSAASWELILFRPSFSNRKETKVKNRNLVLSKPKATRDILDMWIVKLAYMKQ